jgi:hypothetical protein
MAKYVRADQDNLRTWVIQFGIIPLIFAVGFAMMGLLDFWMGLLLLTAATVIYAVDLMAHRSKRCGSNHWCSLHLNCVVGVQTSAAWRCA